MKFSGLRCRLPGLLSPMTCAAVVDLLGAPISQDADFCAEFVLKRVRKIEAFFKRLSSPKNPHLQLVLVRSCLGFARFNFALRTCSPALIVNATAAFDKAMLDVMEVIWNRGLLLSMRQPLLIRLCLM